MELKDPTAWMDDLDVYMDDDDIAGTAATIEPTLVFGGSKTLAGLWIGLAGILGGVLGGLTPSPGIRGLVPFIGYTVFALLLLRGLNPLTKRLFGTAIAWQSMLALFWGSLLAFFAVLGAGLQTRWIAYAVSVGSGAFVGLMYGSLTPGVTKREDTWLVTALPLAPLSAGIATYVLRHMPGMADTATGAAIAGGLSGGLLLLPMGLLLGRIWDEAQGLGQMGLLYLHNENYAPKAVAYFDRALTIEPNNARYYDLRAIGWARMGEYDRASADWDKATSLSPANPDPHINRGLALLRRQQVTEAVRSFEIAVNKSPSSSKAHRHLAAAFEVEGNSERAFEHYDRAVAVAGNDPRAYADRGAAHLKRGNAEQALRDAEEAIAVAGDLAIAYVIQGDALAALGREHEAIKSYRDALEFGSEPSMEERALQGLEKLGASESEDDDAE